MTRSVVWNTDGSLGQALVSYPGVVVDTSVVVAHDEYVYETAGRTGAVVGAPYAASWQYLAGGHMSSQTLHSDTATAYLGVTELFDMDTTTVSGVVGTRYVFAGGVNLGVITAPTTTDPGGGMWLVFGDVQGSATVAMTYTPNPADAMVTRQYYAPYGHIRFGDITATERGWLNQTLDTHTGLTYLNARYYNTTTARFISPDPLLNPGDPRMLDAYMYANNNPVMYTDHTGLCAHLSGAARDACANNMVTNRTYGYTKVKAPKAHSPWVYPPGPEQTRPGGSKVVPEQVLKFRPPSPGPAWHDQATVLEGSKLLVHPDTPKSIVDALQLAVNQHGATKELTIVVHNNNGWFQTAVSYRRSNTLVAGGFGEAVVDGGGSGGDRDGAQGGMVVAAYC